MYENKKSLSGTAASIKQCAFNKCNHPQNVIMPATCSTYADRPQQTSYHQSMWWSVRCSGGVIISTHRPHNPQPYFNYGHALCNAHRNTVVWGNQHLLQPQSRGEASASHAPNWNLHQENLVIGYFTSGHAHRITAKFGKISTVCSLTKSLHSTSTARYVEKWVALFPIGNNGYLG